MFDSWCFLFYTQSLKVGLSFNLPSIVKKLFNRRTCFWQCAAYFGPQRVCGAAGVIGIPAQTQLLCEALPPGFREAVFESRSAGTTRWEGIKENMSDKHNQQPLTSPFICLRSSTEEKGKESSGFDVSAGSISQDLARPMTMNSWC